MIQVDNEEENDGNNIVLFGQSVFHRGEQFEDEGLSNKEVYEDLGDDPRELVTKTLKNT